MSRDTLTDDVLSHLRGELSRPDPWRLEGNAYEQARYAAMRRMIAGSTAFQHGLEVGCAAGAFSIHLAERCRRLRIVDVLPEALQRTRERLGDCPGVAYSPAQIADCPDWGETYDLIVIAEVLYYLTHRPPIARAVAHLCGVLRPGGTLLFGSAIDAVSARWGLPNGAETAMAEWSTHLVEVEREECRGTTADEHSIIARYVKAP